jgi:glycosyltransferase involved in cell wall biosynthesis
MMSGMPIVTTETCGMKDVIQDGRNGLLVPTRSPQAIIDAVERLIEDRGLRTRLGDEARAEALQHYTWEQAALPVQKAYRKILERPTIEDGK